MSLSRRAERWLLLLSFFATAVTGIGLHLSGHQMTPHSIHIWSVAHIICGLAWLVFGIIHITRRSKWYNSILSKGMKNKSWITFWLTIVYAFVVITGLWQLCAPGHIGLWHYKAGLLLIALAGLHIYQRRKALRPFRK